MITTRKIDTRGQAEPLPMYGWRCGMYSLTPELARHGQNPEFLQGLRRGRAQRQKPGMPAAFGLILGLPHMRQMRMKIQSAYADACGAQRRLDAGYRAAARGMGKMSCLGRDMGGAMVSKSDAEASYVAELWEKYNKLSSAYETERRRLLALRGI